MNNQKLIINTSREVKKYIRAEVIGENLTEVQELNDYQQQNFLNELFHHDDALRTLILDRMQELMDYVGKDVSSEIKTNIGLDSYIDNQTGETRWSKHTW